MALASQLTLIVTTSPIPSHPDPSLLLTVFRSFPIVLRQFRVIIVFDGAEVAPDVKSNFKYGTISPQASINYDQYMETIKQLIISDGNSSQPFSSPCSCCEYGDAGAQPQSDPSSSVSLHFLSLSSVVFNERTKNLDHNAQRKRAFTGKEEMLVLKKKYGFGLAVKKALKQTHTPFVMIIQHDQVFLHSFPLSSILNTLKVFSCSIKYIGLQSLATVDYPTKAKKRYQVDLAPLFLTPNFTTVESMSKSDTPKAEIAEVKTAITKNPTSQMDAFLTGEITTTMASSSKMTSSRDGLCLFPLMMWYDKTHVACAQFYRTILKEHVKRGEFIEDTYGHKQLADMKLHGVSAHTKYCDYVLNQGRAVIYHLSGRKLLHEPTKRAVEVQIPPSLKEEKGSYNQPHSHVFAMDWSFCKLSPPSRASVSFNSPSKAPSKFKGKCFGCGNKGHSYQFCPYGSDVLSIKLG